MRILFVQDSLGTGGAERSNADLWYFLREQGVELMVVVLEHRKVGIEREILDAGFNVHFLRPGNAVTQAILLSRIINSYQPDLVHAVLFRSTLRCRLAKLFAHFILVESLVNCTYAKIRFEDPRVNKFLLWLYLQLDRVTKRFTQKFVAITHEVKRHFTETVGIPDEKFDVIYRGRHENKWLGQREDVRMEVRSLLNLATDEFILIHVGRQEFQKGHLVFLQALKKIEATLLHKRITVLMCGRDGNASAAIQQFLHKNKTALNILWLGHRQDVPKLLAASDIFVFPSLYEGLGGSLIEAQAAGLPVICSDLPVFQEVVDADSALMFKTGDADNLARVILHALTHVERTRQMGVRGTANYQRRFKASFVNEQMLALYKRLIQ